MKAEQCVSVTELRRKTGDFIGKDTLAEQFIFIGSKPRNVLLTMKRYEELKRIEESYYEQELDIQFIPVGSLSPDQKKEYEAAISRKNSEFVDL